MPLRAPNQLRSISITPHYLAYPEGSALISWGDTRVICAASVEDRAPPWLAGKGRGWVTAEYDMLPRATSTRNPRDSQRGRPSGRSQEISRLVGRALRPVVDASAIGERTITIDCDVIQADGGTRTAAITGGCVALALALRLLAESGRARAKALTDLVSAVSVGLIEGAARLDLDYSMDSRAEVDLNVVMTGSGNLVEVQGTGEHGVFSREQLGAMLDLALGALPAIADLQKRAIAVPLSEELVTVSLP